MKDVAITGLPFAGKSTVFNAVARAHAATGGGAQKANVAVVHVPDPRLEELALMHASAKTTYSQVRLTDIPGLSANALGDARAADALAIVLRDFGDDADPARDLATFRAELAVADLQTIEKVLDRTRKQGKRDEAALYERAEAVLSDDRWLRDEDWPPEDRRALGLLTPLTLKPVLHVVNVDEAHEGDHPPLNEPVMTIRGLLEAEAADLEPDEADALLKEFGVDESATSRFVHTVYSLLHLVTFYTVGPTESRAWEVADGATAPQAAGVVHSDFERAFIRAEVETYDELVAAGSWEAAREKGLMRVEGREYVVRDGDVLHIRHSA
jgi:hypothetical protein